MTSVERERFEMLTRKAKALRDTWLREREEQMALQLAANAEVRRRWRESGSRPEEQEAQLEAQCE